MKDNRKVIQHESKKAHEEFYLCYWSVFYHEQQSHLSQRDIKKVIRYDADLEIKSEDT